MKEIIPINKIDRQKPLPGGSDTADPLALAFIGDTLFDLYIRESLVRSHRISPKEMHISASHYAKAQSQAKIYHLVFDHLSEQEQNVARRARNAKAHTIPKHAQVMEYRMATGFEALLGWLYLEGKKERMTEILDFAIERFNEAEEKEKSVAGMIWTTDVEEKAAD